ncbi:MAG: ATP-binding protein [Armatimonadota bacterium]
MTTSLLTVELRTERDVVAARQRARQIAEGLGFSGQEQTRIATAVSEIARNAFRYAGGGRVDYRVEAADAPALGIEVSDRGPGIQQLSTVLSGRYRSSTGMGMGIVGARRLMDSFQIESEPGGGTRVSMSKRVPPAAPPVTPQVISRIGRELATSPVGDPVSELEQQNQELLRALDELRERQAEVQRLNEELEDTNRGVLALYAELDEKAIALQQASELKSRFLSYMSHEFRAPLNSILMLSRLLLDRADGPLSPEQERQVGFIRKSATDLFELVNDLLDLAKIESGKIDVHPTRVSVGELFGALRGMFRPLVQSEAVTLIVESDGSLPELITDEGKLSQILRNFVSNALKFTERGEIRVSARLLGDDMFEFSVSDTGIGIAEADLERIFEEFSQVESRLQKQVKGTGLGLPLSRKLAELLGGSVRVESTPGVGSTFHAVIPRVLPSAAGDEPAPVPGARASGLDERRPLLVVEDDAGMRSVYNQMLQGSQFRVTHATTLSEAREAVAREVPAAVVLDIVMGPDLAWPFLAELKRDERTRSVPVVVVSLLDAERESLEASADAFHAKPITRDWLMEQLQNLTARERRPSILIIDDDEVSRYLLRGLLSDTPYAVCEAASGHEGLRAARTALPSAIFLDLVMPDLTGFQVLDELRADPRTRDIPVIINSGKSLSEPERRRLAEKAVAILSKDSAPREIAVARIREALLKAGLAVVAP